METYYLEMEKRTRYICKNYSKSHITLPECRIIKLLFYMDEKEEASCREHSIKIPIFLEVNAFEKKKGIQHILVPSHNLE